MLHFRISEANCDLPDRRNQTVLQPPLQWGFRDNSGTEGAIALAVNKVRQRFSLADLLDLKKAYDLVPRCQLQVTADPSFPDLLDTNIRHLLWPMLLKKKFQTLLDPIQTLPEFPKAIPLALFIQSVYGHVSHHH